MSDATAALADLAARLRALSVGIAPLVVAASLAGCRREPGAPIHAIAVEDAAPPRRASIALPSLTAAMGKAPVPAEVSPGTYVAAIVASRTQYPTMEIHESERSRGFASIELAEGGVASGCFASRWSESYSKSKYASASGKDESTEHARRTFVGGRGAWSRAADGWIDVRFDRTQQDTCPPPATIDPGASWGPIEVRCLRIEANERLSVALIACAPKARGGGLIDDLLVDVARVEPKRWLVLGLPPGLAVASEMDRHDEAPKVSFTTETVSPPWKEFL